MEQGNALYNIEETGETGDPLGDHGRVSGSCRTHMEYDDEYQVEQDIQERRQDQEIQRPFAVPDRTQDTCQQVIHYLSHDSGTDDHYVGIRLIEHIGRCIHPMQDTSHQDHACHSEHNGHDTGQDRGRCNRLTHRPVIARPVMLRGDDCESGCHPH